MKKKWIAAFLAVVLTVAMSVNGLAYSQTEKTADALNELGLFLGTGKGYELENKLTRAEGMALLVRMIGKERMAKEWTKEIPFKDVPLWAIGYVGYAQAKGITNGTSPTTFSPNAELSDYMFLTLVLRALGYSDQGESPSFVWNNPYGLAGKVGLIDETQADVAFTRGDAIEIFWRAMDCRLVGRTITLADSLIAQGIFTEAELERAAEIRKNGRTETVGTPRPELSGVSNTGGNDQTDTEPATEQPWDLPGAKQPKDYTWAEFEALTGDQQLAFQSAIGGYNAFDAWAKKAGGDVDSGNTGNDNAGSGTEQTYPWERPGAKQPKNYTWAEFEALTGNQQLAFQSAIGGYEAFDVWMNKAQSETYPWEKAGAKQPQNYTWAEFEALTGNQQLAFQSAIGGYEAFDAWMNKAQNEMFEAPNPWELPGAKQPNDYTWAEFEALTAGQQYAFQFAFDFESWLKKNEP